MSEGPTYYKALDARGRSCHGGHLTWSLPTWTGRHWVPGTWMPAIPDPVPCTRGYHAAVGTAGLLHWLHERVYVIESQTAWVTHGTDGKAVTAGPVRLVRGTAWDERTARLFAVSCAVDVLEIYERAHPGDTRVSDALVTAWEVAHGFADRISLGFARDAAWAAAGAAARAAARDAAWAAALTAAGAAARGAARATAGAAARDSAWAAAREMQAQRLARYLDGEVDV